MAPVEIHELSEPAPVAIETIAGKVAETESAERRGESVIREMLGATLIASIDDASTSHARSAPADDTPAIFDVDPTPREGDQ